ncbi:hypothetical protein [Brucella pituitosa]|uniref:hypothetical protein n=1 Tax=Brucella pituitosa TaxID=571256 RepID=UPI0012602067|nr:hypothetical protein [Brucella pituitosa]
MHRSVLSLIFIVTALSSLLCSRCNPIQSFFEIRFSKQSRHNLDARVNEQNEAFIMLRPIVADCVSLRLIRIAIDDSRGLGGQLDMMSGNFDEHLLKMPNKKYPVTGAHRAR